VEVLEKCATPKKIRQTWKYAPHLRKWGTLGKARHILENAELLKNAPNLR